MPKPRPNPTKRGRTLGRPWMVSRRHGLMAERRYCTQYLWTPQRLAREELLSLDKSIALLSLFLNGFDVAVHVAVENSGMVSLSGFERAWNDWLQTVHGCKILVNPPFPYTAPDVLDEAKDEFLRGFQYGVAWVENPHSNIQKQ